MFPIAPDRSECNHVAALPRRTARDSAWLFSLGFFLATAASAADSGAASAASEIAEPIRQDLEFTLSDGQSVHVDNPYGNVYLRFGGYEHGLGIHSTLQQPAGAADITFKPKSGKDHFQIAPRLPKGRTLASTQRFDVVVYVPQHHPVRVRTEFGDIESRGVKSDLDLKSAGGHIAARGTVGLIHAETGEGDIEAVLADHAPPGSTQRLATRTGRITVGLTDQLDAQLLAFTSAQFATDYSLQVEHLDGQEPNKSARVAIGAPQPQERAATVRLESLRGEIRLLRRAVFVDAAAAGSAPAPEPQAQAQAVK